VKIFIAVPTYKGLQCGPFFDSLEATVKLMKANGIESCLGLIVGCSYVQMARNGLARQFLENESFDRLFFFDEDMSWEPEAVLAAIRADKDIVAGVYPMKFNPVADEATDTSFSVVLYCDDNGFPLCEGEFLLAKRAMTGFMCIKRGVFEKMQTAYPEQKYRHRALGEKEAKDWFDFFPQGVHNGLWFGEDFAFCEQWAKLGEKIHIMPDILFGHHGKDRSYYGNFLKYLQQRPGGVNYEKDNEERFYWIEDHNLGGAICELR